MKALLDGFVSRSFNEKVARDIEGQQLTMDLLQAFYRREHDTVASLAARGGHFTDEMLQIAVGFRDPNLAQACLEGGITPSEAMVKFALDCRDAPLADMLLKKIPAASEDLRRYIAQKETPPEPRREIDTHIA
jgi:hypothetical protein